MRYKDQQLKGMLLEEAILYLLRTSGYNPILHARGDPTLNLGKSGLEVKGRGTEHQIDAIADFKLAPPFSNPQRLLIEAKFLKSKTDLSIIRNAAGVLKDVSENWVVDKVVGKDIAKKRYHYLYAIFSVSDFTKNAQDYAYAQDIYLLPLRRTIFFQPVISAINDVTAEQIIPRPPLRKVREYIRNELLNAVEYADAENIPDELQQSLQNVVQACRNQRFVCIAMFGGFFPAFLVASSDYFPNQQQSISVRIRWRDGDWFIEDQDGREIFSFDLPDEIFELYAERGQLWQDAVADIKSDIMREFYAFYNTDEGLRVLHFKLDEVWFEAIRQRREQ